MCASLRNCKKPRAFTPISVCNLTGCAWDYHRFKWKLCHFFYSLLCISSTLNRCETLRYAWCYSLMSDNYDTLAKSIASQSYDNFFFLALISRIFPLISWDLVCLELDLIELIRAKVKKKRSTLKWICHEHCKAVSLTIFFHINLDDKCKCVGARGKDTTMSWTGMWSALILHS